MPDWGDRTIASRVALYVCGVVSNRQGFEYVELGPQSLPGSPPQYLDTSPSQAGSSHAFDSIDVDGVTFIRYSRGRQIDPNDSASNRGAYLSVGFLTANALSMHAAANCLGAVSQVYEHLMSHVGPHNRFAEGVRLADYSYHEGRIDDLVESRCSPLLLLDVLMQGMNADGRFGWEPGHRIVFAPAALGNDAGMEEHLLYFNRGAPGARLRLDRERELSRRLTEKLVAVAREIDQARDEWLSYQSVMQEHLPAIVRRGTELKGLIHKVEQLNGAARSTSAARPGRSSSNSDAPVKSIQESGRSRPKRAGSAAHQGRFPPSASRHRGRHARRGRHEFRSGVHIAWFAGGLLIFAAAVFALESIFGRQPLDLTEGALNRPAESRQSQSVEQQQSAEPMRAEDAGRADEPRGDVADERAALGKSRPP